MFVAGVAVAVAAAHCALLAAPGIWREMSIRCQIYGELIAVN